MLFGDQAQAVMVAELAKYCQSADEFIERVRYLGEVLSVEKVNITSTLHNWRDGANNWEKKLRSEYKEIIKLHKGSTKRDQKFLGFYYMCFLHNAYDQTDRSGANMRKHPGLVREIEDVIIPSLNSLPPRDKMVLKVVFWGDPDRWPHLDKINEDLGGYAHFFPIPIDPSELDRLLGILSISLDKLRDIFYNIEYGDEGFFKALNIPESIPETCKVSIAKLIQYR